MVKSIGKSDVFYGQIWQNLDFFLKVKGATEEL